MLPRASFLGRCLAASSCVVSFACTSPSEPTLAREHIPILEPALPRLASAPLAPARHLGASLLGRAPSSTEHLVVAVPAPGARRVVQKTLLLGATGDEPSYAAAQDALARLGIPFRAVVASREQVTVAMLQADSTCNFNSIIFATSGLGYTNASGTWGSALTDGQWQLLADFEVACGAREAIWYAWPSVDLGLNPPTTEFQWTDAVDAHVADPTFFAALPANATIPIRDAAGYGTSVADAATVGLLADGAGNILLARHTYADGREALISTVDQSPYLVHSLALEYDMLRWLTRGMFVGQKRAYLAPQVDDIFIEDDEWVVGVGVDDVTTSRIAGADIDAFVAWQTAFRATLPAGSSFATLMAFNGVGTRTSEYTDQTALARSVAAGSAFLWLSHTWNHDSMDGMTASQASSEITRNTSLATLRAFNGFSRTDLVTPDVSGLQTATALQGMVSAGVRNVVSDTSITEALRPSNPGTNPSFNVGRVNPFNAGIYQVPRHPTNLFYNVATPAEWVDEYNGLYRSYYGRDLTFDEVVAAEAQIGMYYLLRGDIDPLMFHQTNLEHYGNGHSLLGDWLSATVARYLALQAAPIRTLTLRDTAAAMKARRAFDACGITATVVETGTARSLEVKTAGACTVPVTGLAATTLGPVESYLGASTTSIAMTAGVTKTVALP